MKFLEQDLEEIIFNNIQHEEGIEMLELKGLSVSNHIRSYRQPKIGNYGIADIVTYTRPHAHKGNNRVIHPSGHIVDVYELKKENISVSALLQGIRYCKGIKNYFEKRHIFDLTINLILIGKDIDLNSDFIYIPEFLNNEYFSISYYTYLMDINGLQFQRHESYSLIDEGF